MQPKLQYTLFAATLVILIGCGESDMPDVATVTGKVSLDGQPLEGAAIKFWPVDGGRTATAVTDAAGEYSLDYNATTKGAKVGKNEVRVSKFDESLGDDAKEIVPERYNSKSELNFEVKSGESNVANFELKSE